MRQESTTDTGNTLEAWPRSSSHHIVLSRLISYNANFALNLRELGARARFRSIARCRAQSNQFALHSRLWQSGSTATVASECSVSSVVCVCRVCAGRVCCR